MSHFKECQCYLSHLSAEHERLTQLSREVSDEFQVNHGELRNGKRPGCSTELLSKLTTLQRELTRHVELENDGGCLDEAVSRLPSLAAEAHRLHRESERLQRHLQRVIQLVEFDSCHEAEGEFEQFAHELIEHEQHESHLLQQGLNRFPDFE